MVASVIFAALVLTTFIINNINFLVLAIAYTILSFIVAYLTMIICRFSEREHSNCRGCSSCNGSNTLAVNSNFSNNMNNGDLLTISSNDINGYSNDLLTISTNGNLNNNNNSSGCSCGCNSNNNNLGNNITASANIIPNSNGRSGSFAGCYRRNR